MHAPRLLPLTLGLIVSLTPLASQARRALTPEDWYRFQAVSDLKIAPDGATVAYLVTSYDKAADESRAALWTVEWAGHQGEQRTQGESVSEPRFSPDGRYLSFLSARPSGSTTQLWLLERHGGEPRQITHVNAEITNYEWAPDGSHIVLVMRGVEEGSDAAKPAKTGEASQATVSATSTGRPPSGGRPPSDGRPPSGGRPRDATRETSPPPSQ